MSNYILLEDSGRIDREDLTGHLILELLTGEIFKVIYAALTGSGRGTGLTGRGRTTTMTGRGPSASPAKREGV